MMSRDELLNRYLDAVSVSAEAPSVGLLNTLIARHCEVFPFASLGPQLGDELPLDVDSLFDRIVERRRGGYCFEQNGLFFEILNQLGFETQLILARVLHEPGSHPPLTHRVTIVTIEGRKHLADVGFGASGAPFAVPFPPTSEESPTHRVIEHDAGEVHLELLKDGGYQSLYRFELARYGDTDCELGHFYSHRHPEASFVNNLVVSRVLPGEVRSLRNLELRVFTGDQEQRTPISSATQMAELLADQFDLSLTADEASTLFTKLTP